MVDRLLEPSAYLDRAYRSILAMRPTRSALAKQKWRGPLFSRRPPTPEKFRGLSERYPPVSAPVLESGRQVFLPGPVLAATVRHLAKESQPSGALPDDLRLRGRPLSFSGSLAPGGKKPQAPGRSAAARGYGFLSEGFVDLPLLAFKKENLTNPSSLTKYLTVWLCLQIPPNPSSVRQAFC